MAFRFNTIIRLSLFRYWADRIEEWHLLHPLYAMVCRFLGKFIPAPIKRKWNSFSHEQQLLLKNIGIGLAISLFLHIGHTTPWMQGHIRWAMDWTMDMSAGTQSGSGAGKDIYEKLYAFIDIDASQYKAWGEPLFTPRDKLASLIRGSMAAGARLIVVDIDLTRSSPDPRQDAVLRDYLASLGRIPQKERPPIILMKSMRIGEPRGDALPQFRDSFLDDVVSRTSGLYWASPMFYVDDDQIIRYWRMVEYFTTREGPQVLPSAQLLTYALLMPGAEADSNAYEALRGQLAKIGPADASESAGNDDDGRRISLGALTFPLHEKNLENRILYSIKPGMPSPMVATRNGDQPIFLCIPSQTLFTPDGAQRLRNLLSDRIVIIGGSFAESFDIHNTPLGVMPGAMIILNSIRSLFTYGIVHEPSWWITVAIEIILICIMSISFMVFRSFWGMVISGACILFVLVPISLAVFCHGVWLDFALPLVAVQLHQMADEFEHKREEYNKGPWRLP